MHSSHLTSAPALRHIGWVYICADMLAIETEHSQAIQAGVTAMGRPCVWRISSRAVSRFSQLESPPGVSHCKSRTEDLGLPAQQLTAYEPMLQMWD